MPLVLRAERIPTTMKRRRVWLFWVILASFLAAGRYHAFLFVSRVQSIGLIGVYHESRLSRADRREEWTKRLRATNRIEAGRLWLDNVIWVATASWCQDGFYARRVGLRGAPWLPRQWSIIVWESVDG